MLLGNAFSFFSFQASSSYISWENPSQTLWGNCNFRLLLCNTVENTGRIRDDVKLKIDNLALHSTSESSVV